MIEKQVTVSYEEFEGMKTRLKLLEESKLCTVVLSYGYQTSSVHFKIDAPEEFKGFMEELITKHKSTIEAPLNEKISDLINVITRKDATISEYIEETKLALQKEKDIKWWQIWK